MPQAFGGFILGAFAVFLVFFLDPGLAYDIQLRVHGHDHSGRYGNVAVGVEQPFAIGESYTDTSWYADDQDAATTASSACEEVIALENRSDHPLAVDLAVHYRGSRDRDEGRFEAVDGPEEVSLEPGQRAAQVIRAESIDDDERACSALNRHGTLEIEISACPEEEGSQGRCEQEQVDPADALMHQDHGGSHGGDSAPRRDYGRPG